MLDCRNCKACTYKLVVYYSRCHVAGMKLRGGVRVLSQADGGASTPRIKQTVQTCSTQNAVQIKRTTATFVPQSLAPSPRQHCAAARLRALLTCAVAHGPGWSPETEKLILDCFPDLSQDEAALLISEGLQVPLAAGVGLDCLAAGAQDSGDRG